ncbi:MAG TPA: hypothetical protein VGD67_29125 [Pseudonocardiaceae bacterium]
MTTSHARHPVALAVAVWAYAAAFGLLALLGAALVVLLTAPSALRTVLMIAAVAGSALLGTAVFPAAARTADRLLARRG